MKKYLIISLHVTDATGHYLYVGALMVHAMCKICKIGEATIKMLCLLADPPTYDLLARQVGVPHRGPGTGCIRICLLEPDDMVHSYNVNMTSMCKPTA
jgi:hypothetical protein